MDSVCENIEITNQKALINFMNWAKKMGQFFQILVLKYMEKMKGVYIRKARFGKDQM